MGDRITQNRDPSPANKYLTLLPVHITTGAAQNKDAMGDVSPEDKPKPTRRKCNPFMSAEERLAALEGIRELWKDRQPNPIKELEEIRNGWDRDLSPLR